MALFIDPTELTATQRQQLQESLLESIGVDLDWS